MVLINVLSSVVVNPTFVLDTHVNTKPLNSAMAESNLARPGYES